MCINEIIIEGFYYFLAWHGAWNLSNRNGGYGLKTGRCIVAFMIFNFLVYKYPKTGLNCLEGRASLMHVTPLPGPDEVKTDQRLSTLLLQSVR